MQMTIGEAMEWLAPRHPPRRGIEYAAITLRDEITRLRAEKDAAMQAASIATSLATKHEQQRDHHQALCRETNRALGIALIELAEARSEKDTLTTDITRIKAEIAGTRKALEHEHFARELAESQRDALAQRWEDLRAQIADLRGEWAPVDDYRAEGHRLAVGVIIDKMRELEAQHG